MTGYRPPAPVTLNWVRQRCGADDVIRVQRLVGGITADVDRLVLGRRGQGSQRVVLRRWADAEADARGLVERETAALSALASGPVPAPRLVAADPTGTHAGVRCVLMSDVPGGVSLDPDADWIAALAQAQAAVHRTPPVLTARADGFFTPDRDGSWIADAGLRRDALVVAAAHEPEDDVFAHGDFQPFNVLWTATPGRAGAGGGRAVSGVVDWPNAGTGPRGVDVGHCRLNLVALYSPDAADAYLRCYEAAAGKRVGPAAQLRALLVWGPDWQQFLPVQVADRRPVDVAGMRDRVVETIRRTLAASG